MTHDDFPPKEFSVRSPAKPPLTSLSSGDEADGARARYETTQGEHFPEKSRADSNKVAFAGNGNTVRAPAAHRAPIARRRRGPPRPRSTMAAAVAAR